ncbi:MAG: TonB family protein, partial [Deltaproteobacteria bacterium]|nr:TonB family protein [Deltaproteobacteria bacterium]
KRGAVSVGPSEKNVFIVQAPDLPPSFELFQFVGGHYVLNFTAAMTGRVALPGGVKGFEELRASGVARSVGAHHQVRLDDNSRGKISVGDAAVLFQFVTSPPAQPRPQLPAAARGGFVKGIDWGFTALVVLSYAVFLSTIVLLESADWPIEENLAAIPEHYQQMILEEPAPPPEPSRLVDEAVIPDAADAADSSPVPDPVIAHNDAPRVNDALPAQENQSEATARIVQEARAQAEALIIGAFGDGALNEVLAEGHVTTNAAEIMAQAAGVRIADNQSGRLRPRTGGGDSGQRGDFARIRRSGQGGIAVAEGPAVVEQEVNVHVDLGPGDAIGGTGIFDEARVVRMIRMRQSALRRCYETALGPNPSLSGRVVVKFTIEERGTVSEALAIENSTGAPALGACVVGVIRRLRWRVGPEGGGVQFSYPFIFAPQD